jgi:transcriptional regulator with XRE-family HTH domain
MKDERSSTPANEPDLDADALRVALGRRMRMARVNLGLSQQAVADAMMGRGFSWRQTTVAKTEAADRPALFTEVVALSSILKRELSYFLSGRTALDEVKEELQQQTNDLKHQMDHAKSQLAYIESNLAKAVVVEGVMLAIVEFSYTLDTSRLKQSFEAFSQSRAFDGPSLKRVLDAAGVPAHQVEEVDQMGLTHAAREVKEKGVTGPSEWLPGFGDKEIPLSAAHYLETGKSPTYFLDYLRRRETYVNTVCPLLVDDVIDWVESRNHP